MKGGLGRPRGPGRSAATGGGSGRARREDGIQHAPAFAVRVGAERGGRAEACVEGYLPKLACVFAVRMNAERSGAPRLSPRMCPWSMSMAGRCSSEEYLPSDILYHFRRDEVRGAKWLFTPAS